MAKKQIKTGSTSIVEPIFIADSSKTDGSGLTGLTYQSGILTTPVPGTFSTTTTGGSLAPGTYYYRISATNSTGETLASTEASITVPAGTSTNTVTIAWGLVTGATGYKVYGRTTGAELLIVALAALSTYTDTGSITPSGALPSSNTTQPLIACYYKRSNGGATVAVTLVTGVTLGTYGSGSLKEVDSVNCPGMYELGIPDAAFASGARWVTVYLRGAQNMAPYALEIELTATDIQDGVRFGLTTLPNVAAGANGGLPTGNASGQVVASSVIGSVASVTAGVTVTTNNDKAGYALTTAEHTAIGTTDVPAGLTAQGYTTTRAGYLDVLNGLVAAIWVAANRTLSAFGFTVAANNLPSDYQQRGVAVTLPAAPAGYGGNTTAPDNASIATILARTDVATSTRLAATADPTSALGAVLTNQATIDGHVLSRLAASAYTAPPTDYARPGDAMTLTVTQPIAEAVWSGSGPVTLQHILTALFGEVAGNEAIDAVAATWTKHTAGGTTLATFGVTPTPDANATRTRQ